MYKKESAFSIVCLCSHTYCIVTSAKGTADAAIASCRWLTRAPSRTCLSAAQALNPVRVPPPALAGAAGFFVGAKFRRVTTPRWGDGDGIRLKFSFSCILTITLLVCYIIIIIVINDNYYYKNNNSN